MLKLPHKLKFSDCIIQLALPPPFNDYVDTIGELTGFGLTNTTNDEEKGSTLRRTLLRVMENDKCDILSNKPSKKLFCAEAVIPNAGPCHGDDGTSLVTGGPDFLTLIGVLHSTLKTCGTPVLLFKITRYLSWLDQFSIDYRT